MSAALEKSPAAAQRAASGSLAQYWRPRYWAAWLLVAWLRLTAALPWRFAIRLHRLLGRALWHLSSRTRYIVQRNLEICFPELSRNESLRRSRRHFENMGACIAETAFAWFGSADRLAHLVDVEGIEHVESALQNGKGVILVSGHFTALEICVPMIKSLVPHFSYMLGPRSNALLNEFQLRGRRRAAHDSFSNGNVRAMLRALRENSVVWYAPDQAQTGHDAELLTFFDEPAMTSTATSRLARISGAAVIPLLFYRRADDSGYVLRFQPPPEGLPSADPVSDTKRLIGVLEDFVRECPEQYLWSHRRFEGPPPNLPNAYASPARQARTQQPAADAQPRRLRDFAVPLTILGVPLFIAVFDNGTFWSNVLRATIVDEHQAAIVTSLFLVVFCTVTIPLALTVGTRLLKIVAATLLIIAAGCGFFMSTYGGVIDTSIIRSAAETDMREAGPLLTAAFFLHVAAFGVVPSLLLALVPFSSRGWKRDIATRAGILVLGLGALAGTVYWSYGPLSFFGREIHQARMLINPAYPIYSFIAFLTSRDAKTPAERILLDARVSAVRPEQAKPTLVVFVVGETARADRFSLNGYARDTNRYTQARGVLNFHNVTSCGTSTADSLPCLFSKFGRAEFSHAAADAYENLLGSLERLGVNVAWRDNSTGCKHICDPAHFEQLADEEDPELCDSTGCFDAILLRGLSELVVDNSRDYFIVLHQRGSHGPAYYTDVPDWSKEFRPECDLPNLRNCELNAVNNSYDNTILYTDYFLSRVIDFLEARSQEFHSAMLYVSDHGESLGENGLYLHGFPYAIAPREQTHVPMLFWATADFYASHGIDDECVRHSTDSPRTHDSIFHTVLPLYGIEAHEYRSDLDLFSECRRHSG
jgi:lipid A ethanolaminephosphotransferase